MDKTSDAAWKLFKESANYKTMMDTLGAVFKTAGVQEHEAVTELTIKACFMQGYIYRNL